MKARLSLARGLKYLFWAEIVGLIGACFSNNVVIIIFALIDFVLRIAGLRMMINDDRSYGAVGIAYVGMVIAVILQATAPSAVGSVIGLVSDVLSVYVMYKICTITSALLMPVDPVVASKGKTAIHLYIGAIIVAFVCGLIAAIPILNILAYLAVLGAGIAVVVSVIVYVVFLYSAIKAFEKTIDIDMDFGTNSSGVTLH